MSIFAIGDLHLSGNPPKKPMDIFGAHWFNHWGRIKENWRATINADDIVFLVGDISWAMKLSEAQEDLDEIMQMPGKKFMIRGNHDYWWTSQAKMNAATANTVSFIQGHAHTMDNITFGGTRGYLCPGDSTYRETSDRSIYERELLRVETAINAMQLEKGMTSILLLHYPPFNDSNEPSGFTDLLEKYNIDHCIFGHLHDTPSFSRIPETWGHTKLHLVSADYLQFTLKEIL